MIARVCSGHPTRALSGAAEISAILVLRDVAPAGFDEPKAPGVGQEVSDRHVRFALRAELGMGSGDRIVHLQRAPFPESGERHRPYRVNMRTSTA